MMGTEEEYEPAAKRLKPAGAGEGEHAEAKEPRTDVATNLLEAEQHAAGMAKDDLTRVKCLRDDADGFRAHARDLRTQATNLRSTASRLREEAETFRGKGEKEEAKERMAEADKLETWAAKRMEEAEKMEHRADKRMEEVAKFSQSPAKEIAFDLSKQADWQPFLNKLSNDFDGFLAGRFTIPRAMASHFFFPTMEQRRDTFVDLLKNWHLNYTMAGDRGKAFLISLPAAPGMGKTRFAQVAAARGLRENGTREPEWEEALQDLTDGHFKESIEQAVGVTVTFNFDTQVRPNEEHEYMIGVRMLHSHFCRGALFGDFFNWLESCNCEKVHPYHALQLIQYDMQQSGRAGRHIILVIDEVLMTVANAKDSERSKLLGFFCSSLSKIVIDHKNVHILLTSLSSKELQDSVTAGSGRPVLFLEGFHELRAHSILRLVRQTTQKAQRNLETLLFQAVLRESLGIPRLLECIFQVAETSMQEDGTSADLIRHRVLDTFCSKGKYTDVGCCCDAVLAAFTTNYKHTAARERRTQVAEREGYLFKVGFDFQIPPLLLRWWRTNLIEKSGDLNIEAIVRAAINIISLSDVRDGAAHATCWERQLAHLWYILMITNKLWRAEQENSPARTILGQLGHGSKVHELAVASVALVDKSSVFNLELEEFDTTEMSTLDFGTIEKPLSGPADLPPNMVFGKIFLPTDKQNPGFDFAVADKKKLQEKKKPQDVITLVEAKFSIPQSTMQLTKKHIMDKFNLMLKGRQRIQKAFLEQRLCYVIGGLRDPQAQEVTQNMSGLIDEIAGEISPFKGLPNRFKQKRRLVSSCLVILAREHMLKLLTPSLASLPPFAEVVLGS